MPVPHRHIRVVFLDTSSSRCGDVAADDEVLWVRIGRISRGRGRGDEQVHGSGTVDGAYESPDAQDGADRNEEERDEPGAVLRSEAFGHLLRNGGCWLCLISAVGNGDGVRVRKIEGGREGSVYSKKG